MLQPQGETTEGGTALVDCAGAAALLNMSPRGVRKLAERGGLRSYWTPTHRRYYLRADVERIAAERAARRGQ